MDSRWIAFEGRRIFRCDRSGFSDELQEEPKERLVCDAS